MKNLLRFPILVGIIVVCFLFIAFVKMQNAKIDYVPNEETAIKVAEVILVPIYGNSVLNERPFSAELKGNVWTVTGSLKSDSQKGGVAIIEIQKSDCKIISVTHGK